MFDRLESLIGENNLKIINNLHVLIVGIGGVGGSALEALVRSNVGTITIVDHDIITLSNLNRQIFTNQSNIGNSKVMEAKLRALSINPDVKINALNIFIDKDNINNLFNNNYDYVIDACDTIQTKIELINICLTKKIKIISSMGMAKKMNPSLVKITELKNTSYDPLARKLRKYFVGKKVMVLSSEEKVINTNNKILGSSAFVPTTAGILCASYVINETLKEG